MKDKPTDQTPTGGQPPPPVTPQPGKLGRKEMLEFSRQLLRTTDEKEARRLIGAGWPEGTPEFEAFLRRWRQDRETEGWKVS